MNSEKDLDFDTYGEGSREFCPSKTSNFLRVYRYIYIYEEPKLLLVYTRYIQTNEIKIINFTLEVHLT